MYQCKFGQNPLFGSEYIARKQKVDTDANADAYGIRTKNNISPTFRVWGTEVSPVTVDYYDTAGRRK